VSIRVYPDRDDMLLDDERVGFAGEPVGSDVAMPVDRLSDPKSDQANVWHRS
jgi:hypothetical protein